MMFLGTKFSPKAGLLEIKCAEYTVGKDGRLSTVLHLFPDTIDGKEISKVKLDNVNAKNISDLMNLYTIGDKVFF